MSDFERQAAEIKELLRTVSKRTDTAYVVVTVTVLEDLLEQAILSQMRELSNTVYARLFTGYGPLSTFSAKIDLAYALELIDQETTTEFHAIRELRNEFAHARTMAHFAKGELQPIFQRLRGWKRESDSKNLFNERVAVLGATLRGQVESSIFTAAFQNVLGKPET